MEPKILLLDSNLGWQNPLLLLSLYVLQTHFNNIISFTSTRSPEKSPPFKLGDEIFYIFVISSKCVMSHLINFL
jgi:hypothetical protein